MTPTFQPKTGPSAAALGGPSLSGSPRQSETVRLGPEPPAAPVSTAGQQAGPRARIPLQPTAEALSLEQVNLASFINEVFSKTLNLNVQIDQRVMTRTDIVTLRTGGTLPSEDLFRMAENVLAGYGIGVSWDGSVLHVVPEDALMAQMPQTIRGRALPEMPVALRPIFQVVDLHQVSATDVATWLTNAYGTKVKIFPAGKSPAVMLFGLPENVRAAVEAIAVLDQARLAGRPSLRVTPVYWTAKDLTAKLLDVLRAEGYDVSVASGAAPGQTAAVMLVPVESNNSLIAFAADPKVLGHVRQWIGDLDQASQADPLRSIFVYPVQNTTAASLGQIVQGVLGGQGGARGPTIEAPLERAGSTRAPTAMTAGPGQSSLAATPPAVPPPSIGAGGAGANSASSDNNAALPVIEAERTPGSSAPGPRIVIDTARNALVFIGTAQDYRRVRPLLETLDRAPREALIEVTVAELTLNDTENLGFNWTMLNHLHGGTVQRLGTGVNVLNGAGSSNGGIPLPTNGFNYTVINGLGDVRVVLNAFAQNNRVSVLSTPRVLARSGSEAKIEVGTEVPIITSQGTTSQVQTQGNSGIIQSIDYRKTGVLLTVKPVVHSGNRIDLLVSQEVSAALPNPNTGISSPLIQNRNISTELSLSDGQTVVIGGMIAENKTADDSGVPYLKDIPGLGTLFRSQGLSRDRTELMVFITPFVVSGDADAGALTEQFQDQMKRWPVPNTALRF
jgi:general secretion pathway protein D